jgi:hypothetical protein
MKAGFGMCSAVQNLFFLPFAVISAFAEPAHSSRLEFTPPPHWTVSSAPKNGLTTVAPPEGGALVIFSPSAKFNGDADKFLNEAWEGIARGLTPVGEARTEQQPPFETRTAVFQRADGTTTWVRLYALVRDGRGESAIFLGNTEHAFSVNLEAVNTMAKRIKLSFTLVPQPAEQSPAAANSSPPRRGDDGVPVLKYLEPANYYRGASNSPIEYSSNEVNAAIYVYAFRPFTGDPQTQFRRTLMNDWIDPRFREAQLAASPEFHDAGIPGADLTLVARFRENNLGQVGERMRLLVVVGDRAALVDIRANSASSWEKVGPSVRAMLSSLRVEKESWPSPSPRSAGEAQPGLAGFFMGTKSKYVVNLNRGVGFGDTKVALHYYLFSPDGRVYGCYDFPPSGAESSGRSFDFDAAEREDPVNTGRYSIRGRAIDIQMTGGGSDLITGAIDGPNSVTINGVKYERQN